MRGCTGFLSVTEGALFFAGNQPGERRAAGRRFGELRSEGAGQGKPSAIPVGRYLPLGRQANRYIRRYLEGSGHAQLYRSP
jgi:hypothetical protein